MGAGESTRQRCVPDRLIRFVRGSNVTIAKDLKHLEPTGDFLNSYVNDVLSQKVPMIFTPGGATRVHLGRDVGTQFF